MPVRLSLWNTEVLRVFRIALMVVDLHLCGTDLPFEMDRKLFGMKCD